MMEFRRLNVRVTRAIEMAIWIKIRKRADLHHVGRIRGKHGAPKAITATAHKLARIIYHLVKNRVPFSETVFEEQEKRFKKQLENRIRKQAKTLGLKIVPILS